MLNRNEDIKKMKGCIANWMIAEKLGIHENTFGRWMRTELPEVKKREIVNIIDELKTEIQTVK